MPNDVGRGRFGAVGDEDSLLSHVELVVGVVSSIIRDFDLKKVDALFVEETLALLLQGTASVRPSAFVDPFPDCFRLLIDYFLFFGSVATPEPDPTRPSWRIRTETSGTLV